ncbi:hypothetical protein GSI_00533 [Ganoderma sinense ZZ0214-1]|uniref:Uncharacterized protein n=1 Tax=Ganoderma sinense ZZ0214-1 TaxID=1077348 RepID=A0A2G8ST08_9APHY|nr:hypothetical protein GSI_00533 [Ganoderma sinense ZZ0214-1]
MSLLRLLPALRTPAIPRTCVAGISCSAIRHAQATPSLPAFFDALLKDDTPSHAPIPESYEATAPLPFDDDLPPAASSESFPRNPASSNPITLARRSTKPNQASRLVYAVSVKSSRNNTIITFARENGQQILTLTGGKLGFKKSNRNGYEAGYQCAVGIIAKMEEELKGTDFDWKLNLNGFGQGRDAMLTALTTAVGSVVKPKLKRITDKTPLKIGGTRGMKTRRV